MITVTFQIISSRKNIFSWDESAAKVKTDICGLKFFDDSANKLTVKDLKEDIKFNLPLSATVRLEPTAILVEKVEDRPNDLIMHNITFSPPTTAIEFRIEPLAPKQYYDIFIKLNEMASDSDYDTKERLQPSNSYSYLWMVF